MNERQHDSRLEDLYKQYDDIRFRIAMTEIANERVESTMAEIEDDHSGETEQQIAEMSERLRPRIYRLINQHDKATKRQRFIRHKLPRACIAVLCVIGALSIGALTAIASSSYVRHMLMELFIQIDDEYTQHSLVEKAGSEFDVPADWAGRFYPSYIPEGYSFVEVVNGLGMNVVHYADALGSELDFSERDASVITRIDTEDIDAVRTTIHGAEGAYTYRDGITNITWSANNAYFVINISDAPEVALKIAESVILTDNRQLQMTTMTNYK